MRLVFIAGPYAGDILNNVCNAETLGNLAVELGMAPIVVHSGILAGVYGSDSDPAERKRGREASLAILRVVHQSGGELWVISNPDGSMSPGTRAEWDMWRDLSPLSTDPQVRTWTEWKAVLGEKLWWWSQ